MEESLQIRRFSEIPSAEEFASQIEPKNIPAVFSGCGKDWKAFAKWNVSNGGLAYLQELAGSSVVEAMLSRSAPVFYGDIRSHERVQLPFSTFIGYCKDLLQCEDDGQQLRKHNTVGVVPQHGDSVMGEESPQQIYLAQVPIVNAENEEKVQLECLREDIETPAFLEGKILASVNLWMNNAKTRSSIHYDPHHNLLCIISGCKQGQERMLSMPSTSVDQNVINASGKPSNGNAGNCDQDLDLNHQTVSVQGKLEHGFPLHELEQHALRALQELVSLVHDRVNQSQPAGNISANQPVTGDEDEVKKIVTTNLFDLEEDPIAKVVWALEPHAFKSVFLAMAHNFPRTLEAFILHALSPVGIEVLTRKFEQMDQTTAADDRGQFYQKFYSVFDNQLSAMDALLNGKESFACQAFNNVLVQYLGINLDGPKRSAE